MSKVYFLLQRTCHVKHILDCRYKEIAPNKSDFGRCRYDVGTESTERMRARFVSIISALLDKKMIPNVGVICELIECLESIDVDFAERYNFFDLVPLIYNMEHNDILNFCYYVSMRNKGICTKLMEFGYIDFIVDSLENGMTDVNTSFKALSEITLISDQLHNNVIDAFHRRNDGKIGVIKYLSNDSVYCLCSFVNSVFAYKASLSDIIEIIDFHFSVLSSSHHTERCIIQVADGLKSLLSQDECPIQHLIDIQIFQILIHFYNYSTNIASHICIFVGSLFEKYPYEFNISINSIFNDVHSSDRRLVLSSSWCIGMVALKRQKKLINCDILSYLLQLISVFNDSTHEEKVSLFFPIITISRLCTISQHTALIQHGIAEIYSVALTTKAVFLLDALLELINALTDNSSEIAAAFRDGGVEAALEDIEISADFEQLQHTRIPMMVRLIRRKLWRS